MSYPGMNQNNVFKYIVEKNTMLTFNKLTMVPIRKNLHKYITHLIALLVFYENRKIVIFKVLGSFICFIPYNYLFVDWLYLQQDQLSLAYRMMALNVRPYTYFINLCVEGG